MAKAETTPGIFGQSPREEVGRLLETTLGFAPGQFTGQLQDPNVGAISSFALASQLGGSALPQLPSNMFQAPQAQQLPQFQLPQAQQGGLSPITSGFAPRTGSEQALLDEIISQTGGASALRGLGSPTAGALAQNIAPALTGLRQQDIQNQLAARQQQLGSQGLGIQERLGLGGLGVQQQLGLGGLGIEQLLGIGQLGLGAQGQNLNAILGLGQLAQGERGQNIAGLQNLAQSSLPQFAGLSQGTSALDVLNSLSGATTAGAQGITALSGAGLI